MEADYRKNFVINWANDKVNSLKNKDMYKDFNKGKK